MTRSRRVQVIRFWLLSLAALALCAFAPSLALYLFAGWAWTPLGLFMPVFDNDCGTVSHACLAGTKPSSASITISGFASVVCGGSHNCTDLNSTFVAPYSADFAILCTFVPASTPNCVDANSFGANIQHSLSHTEVHVSFTCSGGSNTTAWVDSTTLPASPTDCSAFGTINPTLFNNGCSAVCDATPTSVSVVYS